VKILIVDDHAFFRAGLRMLPDSIGHDVSCVEAATVASSAARVHKTQRVFNHALKFRDVCRGREAPFNMPPVMRPASVIPK
jgi:hypothetical protein